MINFFILYLLDLCINVYINIKNWTLYTNIFIYILIYYVLFIYYTFAL